MQLISVRRLVALTWLAIVVCTDSVSAESVSSAAPAAADRKRATSAAKPQHEQLLDAGETWYPALFPGSKPTMNAVGFRFRYYPETGLYLGVAVDAAGFISGGVYVMGGTFGTQPLYLGMMASFISPLPCVESTEDPFEITPQLCHDLTGDGVIDSRVTTSGNGLSITGAVRRYIVLDGFAPGASVTSVTSVGQYVGGPLSKIVVRVDDRTPEGNRTVLYVIDPESGAEVARWTQAFRTPTRVWVGYPLTTGRRRIPVIAPGQEQSNVTWNYLCKYSPGASGSGCGDNFAAIDAYPPDATRYRRHQGAWLQDADGDGTEDVHISFYSVFNGQRQDGGVLAVSPVNGARTWLPLNMAETARDSEELLGGASQPSYASLAVLAQGFDSGRLYGAASAFSRDGRDRTLLVGGQPVSYYPQATNDPNDAWLVMCNVVRYVGVVGNPTGQVRARQLEWGWYFNFHQAVFRNSSGSGALLKNAAVTHGCIHRYSDSRVTSSLGAPAIAFNVFRLLSLVPSCEAEQRVMFNSGFTETSTRAYDTCLIGTASQPGRWMLQVLDENNGSGVAALQDAYMWGYTDRLLPGGQLSIIVEPFAAPTPFARPRDTTRAMNIYALQSSPTWQFQGVGTFPIAGRPALRYDAYDANPPAASQHMTGNFMHLRTRPNAVAGGLVDVQLENGRWVGYSPQAGTVVSK